jgi:ATP-dependent Clp protease protease subunit
MARINRDDVDKFFDYDVNIPTRTIYVGSVTTDMEDNETGVNYAMAERVIKSLHLLEAASDQPITILMNNPGGDTSHGMAIYDAIKDCSCHVTVIGYGNVCSMGAYIMQAADERVLAPNCLFMFHIGYDGYQSNHPKIIDAWREFYKKKLSPVLDSILLDAINTKRVEEEKELMTKEEFERHNDFDTILTAQEAVDWGFADKILGD